MNKPTFIASFCAFLAAACMFFGYWSMRYAFPDFWDDIAVRMQVIQVHTLLVQLWYFTVWIVHGLAVLMLNYALIKIVVPKHGPFEMLVTLASFVSVSYLFSIGFVEMLSAHSFVSTGLPLGEHPQSSFNGIYKLLIQVRQSTEFSSDIWYLLVNLWLLRKVSIHRIIPLFGIVTCLLGFTLVLPTMASFSVVYVCANSIWFAAVGIWALQYNRGKTAV